VICVVHAHPYPGRSRLNRVLAAALRATPGVELRPLYDLYPDFDVDIDAEQRALLSAELIVWLHPVYWYSVPALLKHWFDKVLAVGWAYGDGGTQLAGKSCLWVPTTGGDARDFAVSGMHAHRFESFVPPIEQTARFCGMAWEAPLVVHGADAMGEADLAAAAEALMRRLSAWRDRRGAGLAEATR
jgi:glutathione-regulated potassium-efflux system ancillary protein KefF